jgi:hypothetical protein
MNSLEAMKTALEALEDIFGKEKVDIGAINALRQAIEQAEQQEPVAWLHPANATCVTTDPTAYARGIPLYTAPPQRKPLTDEEIGRIAGDCLDAWSCARAIEAAHGIKEKK